MIRHKYDRLLWWLGLLLFVGSLVVYKLDESLMYRLLRPAIGIIYLAVLLSFHKRRTHPLMTLFLVVFNISSLCSIWYEVNWSATACMALNFLAYSILVIGIWPKIHFKKLGTMIILGMIAVSAIIGLLLYKFMALIEPNALSEVHFICTWLNALALFMLGIVVFIYNHEYNTKASLSFIFFVVITIFSETFRGIGYYEFAFTEFALHMEKALMILSLSLLIHYSFVEKTDQEPLSLFNFKN